MKNILFYLLLLIVSLNTYSQAKKRTLPRTINAPNYDIYYPAVSGDGNSMIFMSNFTNSGDPSMNYAAKEDVVTWKEPYEMPGSFNKNHLLFEGGYSLNFDGTIAFISMQRSGGLGGYDIWYSKLNGTNWEAPINYGNKLNTGAHEAMPSISSSGQSLYFCKCETINTKEATGCEVYVATKRGASWENSQKLPSNVNSFQPQSPKILADGGNVTIFI